MIEVKKNGLSQYRLVLMGHSPLETNEILQKIMKHSPQQACECILQADKGGAVLCEAHKERIEFLAEQLQAKNIPVVFAKMWRNNDHEKNNVANRSNR